MGRPSCGRRGSGRSPVSGLGGGPCEDAVGAGRLQQVGDEPGADGLAGGALLVLTGVREVRHDGRDTAGRGQLGRLDHEQQLHEVLVERTRPAGRLHQEGVAAADALFVAAVDLAVGERLEEDRAERTPSSSAILPPRSGLLRPANTMSRAASTPRHGKPCRSP